MLAGRPSSPCGRPGADSGFGYEYFDDPDGDGYRGYRYEGNGDSYTPWQAARQFCLEHGVRSAADWGCAKGFLVAELRAAGIDAVGYDVSDYALSFAAEMPCFKKDVREGSPRAVDATFVLGVLLYLEETELPAVLADLLVHTNRFLLVSGYYLGDEQPVPDPRRRITRDRNWWRERFADAGFRFQQEGAAFDVYTS